MPLTEEEIAKAYFDGINKAHKEGKSSPDQQMAGFRAIEQATLERSREEREA